MKKKFEWSKFISALVTALFGGFSLWSIYEYYSLTQLAIATGSMLIPDPTIAVTCITVVIGALLSYFLYQFGLKNSRNKYGVDADGNPYKQQIEYTEIPHILTNNNDIYEAINNVENLDINNNEEPLG